MRIAAHLVCQDAGLPFAPVLGAALTGFQAGMSLADHIDASATANDLAVAMTVLGIFEG
jgi:hypothetical protein